MTDSRPTSPDENPGNGPQDGPQDAPQVVPPEPFSPYAASPPAPLAPPVFDGAHPAPLPDPTAPASPPAPMPTPAPAPATPPPAQRWAPAVVIAFLVILVVAGIIAGGSLLTAQNSPSETSTTREDSNEEPREDSNEEPREANPDDVNAGTIEAHLEAKIDQYKHARSDGSLWAEIPDTEFNRTAVTAFLFFLTDMKIAASFGVDDATAHEYVLEAQELEELLLSEQPLGSDIAITFSDDRVFRYDGDTGEGGYSDE